MQIVIGLENLKKISHASSSRIVFLVIDGVGGLPHPKTGMTELEAARKPNLDRIAQESITGLINPVSMGITPGSPAGHLGLFGYDPVKFNMGRGVIEAVGIGLEPGSTDIVARGNFCTVDNQGVITDRRAGRISTEKNAELCRMLGNITISGIQIQVTPVREHRFVLTLRGEGLSPEVTDSDPQEVGKAPLTVKCWSSQAQKTVDIVNKFIIQAGKRLQHKTPANMFLLRGFSRLPHMPSLHEIYKLTPAAIAVYPMYRGLARLAGMEILPAGNDISSEMQSLVQYYTDYDFFFVHFKTTDSRGEDGDFTAKVHAIEELDNALPALLKLDPEVLVVTGDHSTPAVLAMHSWHPVPFMLRSKWCFPDKVSDFSERACLRGGLGQFPAVEIMPLAMANAQKLNKFGA
jgi:2,3-bisphosphoglycerate-independent phosphoglycerate mutase